MYMKFGLIYIRSESLTKIGSAISMKSPAQILSEKNNNREKETEQKQ